jgi:structural maintenance of chromosome 2
MFNVVVDSENTGKQLLQNGNLRRRVTIIPLNKIQSHTVPTRVRHAAVRLVSHCIKLSPQLSFSVNLMW